MTLSKKEAEAMVSMSQAKKNPELSENALRVLRARYLKKDEAGQVIETPVQLYERVASTMADVEKYFHATPTERDAWQERFYDLLASGRFMPNSPTLMNAGREMGLLSACFVLPVRDSVSEIFDAIKQTALIQKAGGGTGFAFDELRPTGDYIRSSGGTTSGPISFWRAFSEATNAIQQGAFRRGANMGMMNIHHPDILKFLHAKEDLTQFTNYNISVKVSDAWMESFLKDADSPHVVRSPRTGQEYLLPRDLDIKTYGVRELVPVRRTEDGQLQVIVSTPASDTENAGEKLIDLMEWDGTVYSKQDVWNIVVRNAHRTGEPGIVFIDRINQHNPTPHVGRIEATNPCGEQPLLPYEACNLGSINLAKFITDPCTTEADVDWELLRKTVHESMRFLDNVIEANRYPLPEIERMCKNNRKIGLGVMGFADALYMLGVSYASEAALAWGEKFMQFINDESHRASEQLASLRGCFPNWAGSIWDTRYSRPMRNAATTTVAPTGTISIIAGCSGGIEPMFSLAFFRNVLKGQDEGRSPMVEINPIFEQVARVCGFYSDKLMERIAQDGTLAHIDEVPEDVKRVFVCAHDISPEWHVRMQAAFQKHVDASISKTINFPHTATVEQVDTIYRQAYALGCKGVTVYRDGCRQSQPMALKDSAKKAAAEPTPAPAIKIAPVPPELREIEPRDIPEIVSGLRLRQMTPFGNMHVKITVDVKTGRELEVFAQLGKGGDIANSDLEAICRLTSLWLRSGGALHHIIRQLKDIGSSLQVPTRDGKIMSLGDGLARALMKYKRAKERFGLHDLLLGECDLSELDRPVSAGSAKPAPAPKAGNSTDPKPNGKGSDTRPNGRAGSEAKANGNGEGKTHNGNGSNKPHTGGSRITRPEPAVELRRTPATAESPLSVASLSAVPQDIPLTPRTAFKIKCPSCGEGLVFAEGCNKCFSCGWAQC